MGNMILNEVGQHDYVTVVSTKFALDVTRQSVFTYTFENFFHPFVGALIEKLNKESLTGMLDPFYHEGLTTTFFNDTYMVQSSSVVGVNSFPKEIDVHPSGPYANYNWELLFHIPFTVAVHLSKTQRFAEAQRWFHLIFNPTSTDQTVDPPERYWRFLAFRRPETTRTIDRVVQLLSTPRPELSPADQLEQDEVLNGYRAILNSPFQPHKVARTRHVAYQYAVVMKYLDNLIAWGDSLFQQDTIESINEATQRYVLAANILGPRPQQIPAGGTVKPKTFAQLKQEGLGPIGNAFVEMEGQFPLNFTTTTSEDGDGGAPLFGIGRALYFCIPRNDKLLGYWDTVADRLFKIRHCMNIAGIVRPLALFDPPLDPGMLVKAAAAGIDIGSIVNGLNQPASPVRCLFLIQKSLELCSEVRGLGSALLSALEKADGEHLALLRQKHEIRIQQMSQEVKYLQWQAAREATKSLLTNRGMALERLRFYQRVLGLPADPNAPDDLKIEHTELTEENFDEVYNALVGKYDKLLAIQKFPGLKIAGGSSPAQQSGASGAGRLYLNANEDAELNSHLPRARDTRLAASINDSVAAVLTFIPDFDVKLAFWGMGAASRIFGGAKLHDAVKGAADILRMISAWEQDQAVMASRTAGHERRADDWMMQYNLAAREVMQIGRQILTSMISEQVAQHEYKIIQQQIKNAEEVDQFVHDKFTNKDLYLWMQGEMSRLYYEYYRFAFDTARKAERTMKQELMRSEVDAQDFVKFNYWDGGRKGLLSGEALHLDVKRMEMAYHENNKRELELTRHVSLRQLNSLALLTLKTTGTCQVTIPEWLFDRDCPGHYMRRIKRVGLSIPSVVGPYTNVNCTLSLLRSTVRKSPIAGDDYLRQGTEDNRFVDYTGAVQSIVTSSANDDGGLFETNLRDDRFLPFEGAGGESTWKLDLPKPDQYPAFDYATISDVIFHVRYTARQGVQTDKVIEGLDTVFADPPAKLTLLFSLRHDFPTEWSTFVNGSADFTTTIRRNYFPYFASQKTITILGLDLYGNEMSLHRSVSSPAVPLELALADEEFVVTASSDTTVLQRSGSAQVFLVIRYSLGA